MKRIWQGLLLCIGLMLWAVAVSCAEEAEREVGISDIVAILPAHDGTAQIYATKIDGEDWLFLPSFADMNTLTLMRNGEELSWVIESEEDYFLSRLVSNEETVGTLRIMKSENLRAVFLYSDDPVEHGREYIDGGEIRTRETTGSIALVDTDGTVDLVDGLRQIRTRGNGTWWTDKKSYQIKLENRFDLLKSGDPSEKNRTWVLLADHYDKSALHNRIALDAALEFGLTHTSRCEHVDLYYDGEYRGLYLLAEKVEVGEGRIEVEDYDKLIEIWSEHAGERNMEALEVRNSQNIYGNEFTYIEDVIDITQPDVGAYLLEMEHEHNTLSDRCWLKLGDGSLMGVKNPENASETMMRYISEHIEEARLCLMNQGINPQTKLTMEDYFDVEAFARTMLMHEALQSMDGFTFSSTWFVLPAGQKRFSPGPVWDFDVGMRLRRSGDNAGGVGQNSFSTWTQGFYTQPIFMKKMKTIWQEELCPLLQDILLGEKTGTYLKPLDEYVRELSASYRMNDVLWDHDEIELFVYGDTWEEDVEQLRKLLTEHFDWLSWTLENNSTNGETIFLWGNTYYRSIEEMELYAADWSCAEVQIHSLEKVSDATEDEYAQWKLEAMIIADEGISFDKPVVYFGQTPIRYEKLDEKTLKIAFTFEDLTYRPVDYYGEDIGMVYNPDVYAMHYPEIAEMYEGDPEGLVEYFCEEGMYENQKGNAFFQPSEILDAMPALYENFGTDWYNYYWDFIYYGYTDGWLRRMSYGYPLTVLEDLM